VDTVFAYLVDGVYVAEEQRPWPAEQAGREIAPTDLTQRGASIAHWCLPSHEALDRSAKAVLQHIRTISPRGYGLKRTGTRKDPQRYDGHLKMESAGTLSISRTSSAEAVVTPTTSAG
jgi:hypothetical protein